jgi:uncharacterized linocin/CFP29 family protein
MNDLLRELAPISDAAWGEIEAEAKRTLKLMLAARKLVDFRGPLGWDASAVSLGHTERLESTLQSGVESRLRRVQPLVELRTPFELSREELEAVGRGARDPDLDAVRQAARNAALAEDRAVFHGYANGTITGIIEAAADNTLTISDDYEAYPSLVAEATNKLRTAGVATITSHEPALKALHKAYGLAKGKKQHRINNRAAAIPV